MKRQVFDRRNPGRYYFVGEAPQLRACYSQGRTIEELLANMREVIELCLEEQGDEGTLPVFLFTTSICFACKGFKTPDYSNPPTRLITPFIYLVVFHSPAGHRTYQNGKLSIWSHSGLSIGAAAGSRIETRPSFPARRPKSNRLGSALNTANSSCVRVIAV